MAEFEPYSVAQEEADLEVKRRELRSYGSCCDVREVQVCGALRDWLLSRPRPSAKNAFAEGDKRHLARHIEDAIRAERKAGFAKGRDLSRPYAPERSYLR